MIEIDSLLFLYVVAVFYFVMCRCVGMLSSPITFSLLGTFSKEKKHLPFEFYDHMDVDEGSVIVDDRDISFGDYYNNSIGDDDNDDNDGDN